MMWHSFIGGIEDFFFMEELRNFGLSTYIFLVEFDWNFFLLKKTA